MFISLEEDSTSLADVKDKSIWHGWGKKSSEAWSQLILFVH